MRPLTPAQISLEERTYGKARNGEVHIRDFDRGVVETFGGKVVYAEDCEWNGNYFLLNVAGVRPPPGMPGVPVNFSLPEDTNDVFIFPSVVIVRDDITPATNRRSLGALQYRVPAYGALPAQTQWGYKTATGYNKMAERPTGVPYDISYTISVYAYRRGDKPGAGAGNKSNANALLEHVLRWYQPYTGIDVYDSVGDRRVYFATTESASPLDESANIGERIIGWSLPMTVEAELDLTPELTYTTAQGLNLRLTSK